MVINCYEDFWFKNKIKMTLVSYFLHEVGYGDFQEGGEICNPGAAGIPEDGELGQEDMQGAPLGRQCQQLAVISPGQCAQP